MTSRYAGNPQNNDFVVAAISYNSKTAQFRKKYNANDVYNFKLSNSHILERRNC